MSTTRHIDLLTCRRAARASCHHGRSRHRHSTARHGTLRGSVAVGWRQVAWGRRRSPRGLSAHPCRPADAAIPEYRHGLGAAQQHRQDGAGCCEVGWRRMREAGTARCAMVTQQRARVAAQTTHFSLLSSFHTRKSPGRRRPGLFALRF